MNKRVTAFLCALALLVGLLPAGAVTIVSAEANKYQVGYAKVNINPWTTNADGENVLDTSLNLYLSGNGDDKDRLMDKLYDDNGDTNVDDQDGLFATATAITDNTGKTVIYITVDSLQGYGCLITDVRTAIVDAIDGISTDQIMISASHTHSSFQLEYLKNGYYSRVETGVDENGNKLYDYYDAKGKVMAEPARKKWTDYYWHIVEQIKIAAEAAIVDQAPATMSKGTVNAKEATKNLGYNKDQDGNPQGYHMNAIRHYEVTVTADKYKQGLFGDRYDSTVEKNYIIGSSGDPFNEEDFKAIDGYTYKYVKNTFKPVEESDNNMHVLLFNFDDNSKNLPVAFVNWRAHTTMNSGVDENALSSDYVNGLRTTLEGEGYRAAFFQGAAGNVVTTARSEVWEKYPTYKDWQNELKDGDNKTFIYGRMLAEVAEYCIKKCMEPVDAGKIRTHQMTWHGDKQPDSDGLRAAAAQINADEAADPTKTTNYPYRYECDTDGDGENELYIVNTSAHKKNIGYRKSNDNTYTNLELNVIMLGDNVAFVTAPNELADKYHNYKSDTLTLENELISASTKNDWKNLLDDTYGTPFVLGYTNGSRGYIGNWLDHTANSSDYTSLTGYASGAESIYGPGTYESMISRFAQGEGEELIARYKTMLDSFKGTYVAECEACNNEKVEWFPIYDNGEYNQYNGVKAGHYYLAEYITDAGKDGQWSVGDGSTKQKTCIDLMGHDKTSESRNFNIKTNATLNLMDSVGGAEVQSQTYTDNALGGNIYVDIGGTFNLYGGTLSLVKVENDAYPGVGWGGVVYLHNTTTNTTNKTHPGGSMNMYGGTVIGADLVESSSKVLSTYNGCGGAIYVRLGSVLNVYGGTITSGSVPDGKYGPCVFVHDTIATVTLSGDADVENVFFAEKGDNLIIKGEYTGTAGLTFFKTLRDGLDIGNCFDNASLSGANITCTNEGVDGIYIDGADLRLSMLDDEGAILCDSNGAKAYDTFDSAMMVYDSTKVDPVNGYIKLMADVSAPTINENVAIDLNGYNMSGVNVNNGRTLYGMDSQTDDYTVADEEYGKITKGAESSGKIDSVPAEYGYYLMITEGNDISFHRYNLQVHKMTLRPNTGDGAVPEPGVYYKSYFAGDEKVKEQVDSFGVALSVYEMPDADNMNKVCKYSEFKGEDIENGFNSGNNKVSYTGTLLKGIMKGSNSTSTNGDHANMGIYGRAYIKLKSGGYLFGEGAIRSLKQQIELADNMCWDQYDVNQKQKLVDLCRAYDDVTKNWDIPNINAWPEDDGVLRVLTIGHSLSNDANWLLSLVANAEGYENLSLGFLYYSGCKLNQHVQFMKTDSPKYELYTTNAAPGNVIPQKIETVTMKTAVEYADWDIIVMQGGVFEIARDATYTNGDIQQIQKFVNEHKKNPKAVFGWNFAWAPPVDEDLRETYSGDSYNNAYIEFGNNRENMYNAIIECVSKNIVTDNTFKYVIPSGTIFENALTSYLTETDMHRDYAHATDLARVMVSYLWFCKLTGVEQLQKINLDAIPKELLKSTTDTTQDRVLTENEKEIILETVNNALKNPLQTTQSQYTQAPAQ